MTSPRVLLFLTALAAQAQVSITTYRNDLARSGANPAETILTPANVSPTGFGKLFSLPVDGQVYAQPLYVPLVNIPGKGIHNVVFVATEHDSVYAFDADSATGPTAAPLWHVNFTNLLMGERPLNVTDVLGCLSIQPELGITGTPVIDPSTGTLYAVASTILNGEFFHRLHALDISTGAERPGSPVVIQATVPGAGDGFSQATVPFHPYLYKNRAGLLLANGAVYTAWTSHCDAGSYHGWLIGYDAANLQQIAIFNDSPNAFQGALWMGGAAPAADAEGNIYVISGNGPFDGNSNGAGLGDSFIKLSSAGGLKVTDYFTPFNQLNLNRQDIDLGSSGALLLPDGVGSAAHPHLAVGAGKEGRIYLLDRDRLGGFNAADDSQIVQSVAGAVGPIYGGAAYFNGTLFFAGANDSLKAFSISEAHLMPSPSSQSPQIFGEQGAAPVVSSNGASSGIVWLVEPGSGGTVHAYDASNLSHELYNSQIDATRDALGGFVKFSVPVIASGKVYVANNGSVAVYGLLNQSPQPRLFTLVNAASLRPGPVAPGSLISIFGSGLAPATGSIGVTLSINGIACPLLFAGSSQINAQVPYDVMPGPATAVLQMPQMPSAAIALTVDPVAPGIFAVRNADGSLNNATSAAKPGSSVSVELTGQGSSSIGSYRLAARVGRRPAEILSAALTPGSTGLLQVIVRVPAVNIGVSQLVIEIDGVSSNAATLYVAASPAGMSAKRK